MPSRFVTLLIVGFWMTATAWMVNRDVLHRLQPGDVPPFAIDLVDEADHQAMPTRWSVIRGGKTIGRARSWVVYRDADDTFALNAEMERLELLAGVHVPKMATVYRVNRQGELREMTADLTARVSLFGRGVEVAARLRAAVRDGQFAGRGTVEMGGEVHEIPFGPVPVAPGGAVLNPLHPVNRVVGLRLGQRWRMPLVNPLSDLLADIAGPALASGPRFLDAEVLPEARPLLWNGREEQCLVIEYRDDRELVARTWARHGDGLVLRQEAAFGDDLLVLQRD